MEELSLTLDGGLLSPDEREFMREKIIIEEGRSKIDLQKMVEQYV